MRNCLFSKLDACFAVCFDHIATYIWVTLSALDYKSVVAARRDDVLPNFGCTELRPVCARYFDAVLVRVLYFILDDVGLVVVDLNADLIQIELVANYLSRTEKR